MVSKEDLEASKSRKYCLSLRGAKITEEWRARKKVFPQKNSLAKGPVFISVAIALLLLVGQTAFASCQGFDPWAGRPMGEFEGAFHISDERRQPLEDAVVSFSWTEGRASGDVHEIRSDPTRFGFTFWVALDNWFAQGSKPGSVSYQLEEVVKVVPLSRGGFSLPIAP